MQVLVANLDDGRDDTGDGDDGLVAADENNHYAGVSTNYHTAFFYSGEYEAWQQQNILSRLKLGPANRLVDIGGGTGRFASLLYAAASLEHDALCVDPSPDMLSEAAKLPGIKSLCQGGLEFATGTDAGGYDRVLLKEVVHHLKHDELTRMFGGLWSKLPIGGVCLVCTRPQIVDYPFFQAALEVWSQQQPAMEYYEELLSGLGFVVTAEVAEYPASLNRDWWLEMVGNRFWSTFSHFSDEDLAAGIQEIRAEHEASETISFTEKMVFITATKPC